MTGPRRTAAGALTLILCAANASGQPAPPEPGVVTGVGTVTLKRRPDLLRLTVDVFGAGKTMKAALENLKDRRKAVAAQLKTLGAATESAAFGEPGVNTSLLEARQQMLAMIRNSRPPERTKKDAGKGPEAPTIVTATLTAEWPLKGKDTEAILVEVAALQDAINAADLPGRKDVEKLSTEDEELREELQGVEPTPPGDPNRPQPGTPVFTLVSKVSPAEQARALADAFGKARSSAETTAGAAGAGLGRLHQLAAVIQSGPGPDDTEGVPQAAYARMIQSMRGTLPVEPESASEAQGRRPGAVSYQVTVSASFSLKAAP